MTVSLLAVTLVGMQAAGGGITAIGGSKGSNVTGSKFTRGDQRTATPFEPFACQLSEEQVGHQASVATIAVGVNVDCDEAMMIAGSDFGGRVGRMLNLCSCVAEHLTEAGRDFRP